MPQPSPLHTRPIPLDVSRHAAHGGGYPVYLDALLLRTALLQGDAMLEAWQAWRRLVDFDEDRLTAGTMHLLPLVYHNLARHNVEDAILGRLRGIYRRAWVRNQMHCFAGATLLQALHDAGIATLVLGGAALVTRFYPDLGTRPLEDVDVLVPTAQAQAAIDTLMTHSWQPRRVPRPAMTPTFLAVRHAQYFTGPDESRLDLHWRPLSSHPDATTTHAFWQAALALRINQVETLSLCPTDQLLHACVEGPGGAAVRWVADVVMILRGATIDWPRLVEMARRCRGSLATLSALRYVCDTLDAPIPGEVLDELATHPVSAHERRLFVAQTQRATLLGPLPLLWQRYRLARADGAPVPGGLTGFPTYVRIYYGKRSLSEMARWALARAVSRAHQALRKRGSVR